MKVKNTKAEADSWAGMLIEPGAYYTIQSSELFTWQNAAKVLTDIASGALVMNDEAADIVDVATAMNYLLGVDTAPKDSQGRPITKPAVTSILNGSYQLHALEFQTSKLGSIYNKDENGNDLGFATIKLYKEDGTEITDVADEGLAVKTVVDWMTSHALEIIGGELYHAVAPTGDCRLWIIAAPGILNVKFGQGGINLRHVGAGSTVRADGRATKYLPTSPAGINKMRLILKHEAGLSYNAMMLFELFKA